MDAGHGMRTTTTPPSIRVDKQSTEERTKKCLLLSHYSNPPTQHRHWQTHPQLIIVNYQPDPNSHVDERSTCPCMLGEYRSRLSLVLGLLAFAADN